MSDRTVSLVCRAARLACLASSPLPYTAVLLSFLGLACLALLAVCAAYLFVLYSVGACLASLAVPYVRTALASLRSRYNSAVRAAAYRRLRAYASRCRAFRAAQEATRARNATYRALPTASAFVPSSAVAPHECPAHGATPVPVADVYDPDLELSDTDYAACLAPVATLLPTEARRTALPVASSVAGRFPLTTVSAPAFVPAGLLSYTPAPAPVLLSGEALYAALSASRAALSAGIARVRADYTSPPAAEECVQVAACPASELAPSAPLAPAPMSYRELQAACKARGLSAKGSAAVLRERLAR